MITNITCPKCNTDGGFSLAQPTYNGPYRCWKCKEFFTISIENNTLNSITPLSQEEFEQQRDIDELKKKFRYH